MGYLKISNLYKNKQILHFKQCYALEKIHGTSAHIGWKPYRKENQITLFSGGERHSEFQKLFDLESLKSKLSERYTDTTFVIHGEAYGGRQQKMAHTYGPNLKFIAFDVAKINIDGSREWLSVPHAHSICEFLEIEFVDYALVSTDLNVLNAERDKDSTQAIRNGMGSGKIREGVILRPVQEFKNPDGSRIICKHKRDEFMETKTPRSVNVEELAILENADAVAEEWATEMRLHHVWDKIKPEDDLPKNLSMMIPKVIDCMVSDIYFEAYGEIVESDLVRKAIGRKTSQLFKKMNKENLL